MFSLLIRQPAKSNAVINGNLANGVNGVLDMRFVGFLFGHGNFPSLDHKCGAKALFAFAPYLPYQQRQPELSKTARGGLPAFTGSAGFANYGCLFCPCLSLSLLPLRRRRLL